MNLDVDVDTETLNPRKTPRKTQKTTYLKPKCKLSGAFSLPGGDSPLCTLVNYTNGCQLTKFHVFVQDLSLVISLQCHFLF